MKRYTLRGLLHDAQVFTQLWLEYRRTKQRRRTDICFGGLVRSVDGMGRRVRV